MDTYKEELYGKILWTCYRSKAYIFLLSLVYVIASAAAIIFAITHNLNHGIIFYVLAALVVLISLWRINRVHYPVALICEKKLLVAIPWSFLNSDYYISLKARYMPVDYKEVAGVSDGWNRIYIGAPVVGGMVPCRCSWLSYR